MKTGIRLCKDCKHITMESPPRQVDYLPFCRRAPRGGFYVDGEIIERNFVLCEVERSWWPTEGHTGPEVCGPEGKFFEAFA